MSNVKPYIHNYKKYEKIVDKLYRFQWLNKEEFLFLIQEPNIDILAEKARLNQKKYYKNNIYIRGLIEISNYCKQNCYYCGIRRTNTDIKRYRLTKEDILQCCQIGYNLGFKTFVLQGGEDPYYTDKILCDIVSTIKSTYKDVAVTLSVGVREIDSYKALKKAGADRFLLRHETANSNHFNFLHPKDEQSLEKREEALFNLKKLGYQVGSGIMVGSPNYKKEYLYEDLFFLKKLNPHMIGIGPFIPHKSSKFKNYPHGDVKLTLAMLSILRLVFPKVLLPSTTALGTIDSKYRYMGIQCGANVIMPNLSPVKTRQLYSLYDNKIISGNEVAENLKQLQEEVAKYGYQIVKDRGDSKVVYY